MRSREDGFEAFVAMHGRWLATLCYALTGHSTDAEDLAQDVLARLYAAWPRVDDPRAYARRAAANASSDRWRRRGRRPEVPFGERHDRPNDDPTAQADDRRLLVEAIRLLPSRQRAVVVLRYLEDLTESEVAALLGCSVGTVKSQTSRALARLREHLAAPAEGEATALHGRRR
jgi:RNA polymerase sigma-70 factor (sigma-E family)